MTYIYSNNVFDIQSIECMPRVSKLKHQVTKCEYNFPKDVHIFLIHDQKEVFPMQCWTASYRRHCVKMMGGCLVASLNNEEIIHKRKVYDI